MNSGEDTFDYVIVGAGSAGCVLAYRLAASGKTVVAHVTLCNNDITCCRSFHTFLRFSGVYARNTYDG